MNPALPNKNNKKMNPFAAIAVGFLLFLGAFPVLFINEAQENLANVARKSQEYANNIQENLPVYAVGSLNATNKANDSFILGDYVVISRTVEMYGYQEIQSTVNSQDRYTYNKSWVINPGPTTSWLGSTNEHPSDLPINYNSWVTSLPINQSVNSTGLSINGINIDHQGLVYTGLKPLELIPTAILNANYSVQNNYLYFSNQGTGTSSEPQIGDIRLSFSVIEFIDSGLLLGSIAENKFVQFTTSNGNHVYRFFNGETDINSVISTLQSEYELTLWIFRGIGFLMLFIGLLLTFRPLMSLFKFVPFFGDVGNFLLTIIIFFMSLALTMITVILSFIVQNIIVVGGVVVTLIVLFIIFTKKPKPINNISQQR